MAIDRVHRHGVEAGIRNRDREMVDATVVEAGSIVDAGSSAGQLPALDGTAVDMPVRVRSPDSVGTWSNRIPWS